MRVEMKCADQTRIANGYKSYPMLAPIAGQLRSTARYRRTMVMPDNLSAIAAVLSLIGILSSFPSAQAQARCKLMHDLLPTNPEDPTPPQRPPFKLTLDFDSKRPVEPATKEAILNNIMETGIPCQETVTGDGPEGAKKTQLQHRQRGFDFYSWLTFIALNSPADGRTRIDKSLPNTKTMWEDRKNFKQLLDVMLPDGAASKWTDPKKAPPGCESEFKPDIDMGIEMIEVVYNQPFKTGALIDQQGNYALFDILMNKDMFDYIQEHKLYSKAGQQSAENAKLKVDFPTGVNPPKGQIEGGRAGGIIIKVSWKILDSEAEKRRFHTVDAVISMLHHDSNTKPACVRKTLGLVGFHVMHKTETRLQWIWTSFEHVDNVPEQSEIRKQKSWNFYKVCNARACPPVNETPPRPWEPKPSLGLKFDGTFRSQIVRTTPLTEDTKKINRKFQEILRGTVWENYMLLSTQWPSDFRCAGKKASDPGPDPNTDFEKEPDMNCAPAPTFLANSTLETYSQGKVPLASSSCMACHGNATSYQLSPRQADQFESDGKSNAKFFNQTDFTFMLEKARGETQK
jgi:hypothetical protein